ncbi:MAG: hypothetical protein ACK5RG_05230 [Cyclobacteriaceae bacterium]|jgi:hypothetical protein|nr:hypothetical protein [Flammeovirgaceae bacterium]
MEVMVFATSVQSHEQVKTLAPKINSLAGKGRWNFALDDCDKILRIVSDRVKPQQAVALLEKYGFTCNELD